MTKSPQPPLIVQGDQTLLLDVHTEDFEAARDDINRFAELEKFLTAMEGGFLLEMIRLAF